MAQIEGNFACTSCGQSFDTQADLRDHEESRHSSGERSTTSGSEPERGGDNWRTEDHPERGV